MPLTDDEVVNVRLRNSPLTTSFADMSGKKHRPPPRDAGQRGELQRQTAQPDPPAEPKVPVPVPTTATTIAQEEPASVVSWLLTE